MPGGLTFDSTQSYVAFAVVKFVGYGLSAVYFNKRYSDRVANPFLFGIARTILGMSVGAIVGLAGLIKLELAVVVFIWALIPFRIGEWFLTLWLFYRQGEKFASRVWTDVFVGVLFSFILDVPAILGFLATGGLWIC